MAIIDEIKAAEKKAQQIKDDARASGRADAEMIEVEAKKKAAEMKQIAQKQAEERIDQARRAAEEATAKAKRLSDDECRAITDNGRKKLDEAAELIFKGAIGI